MLKRVFPATGMVIIVIFSAFLVLFHKNAVLPVYAESGSIVVSNITPVFVERGTTTYMVTLRVLVANNSESENVSIEVTGKDDQGFTLQNVRFTGNIQPGTSRMLMERFQIRGETYERIESWEVR